ncbi:MAG: hypothetical protein J7K26_03385 [Candidatus Aenigmarchaeota archaeon]|nr:hypothetical protein [Candidatus Aenigmarchaeota archaeon]
MAFPFLSKPVKKVYIPVDIVQALASQGKTESEIETILRSKGFNDKQITMALRLALKDKVSAPVSNKKLEQKLPIRETPIPRQMVSGPVPMGEPIGYQKFKPPQTEKKEEPKFTFEEPSKPIAPAEPEITLEEIIEGIIAEKWEAFEERLANFEQKDLQLQEQINDLRGKIEELKKELDKREANIINKVGDYGTSMENIEARIGSIEKIFKDFIPELSETLKKLSETH